jgi:hypothetical protein
MDSRSKEDVHQLVRFQGCYCSILRLVAVARVFDFASLHLALMPLLRGVQVQ